MHLTTARISLLGSMLLLPLASAGSVGTTGQPQDPVIRRMIRTARAQEDICQQSARKDSMKYCQKRDATLQAIRARGWCWGSTNPNAAFADLYWLKCSKNKMN